jgi:catechol 2,3-dioxygenase-like lactoylglutathione lyase family enzyme
MRLHHVAIRVDDIQKAADWYTETLSASISYQDNSWALLEVKNTCLALVLPEQLPYRL